jgi:signal peptidase I
MNLHRNLDRFDPIRGKFSTWVYRNEPVEIGDLVVFRSPANPKRTYIKRVVALAEDKVEIHDGQLLVNDQPVGDPDQAVDDFGSLTVPKYNFFALGDNRAKSKDSRHFGPVPDVAVQGKASTILWPQESWSRFGRIE